MYVQQQGNKTQSLIFTNDGMDLSLNDLNGRSRVYIFTRLLNISEHISDWFPTFLFNLGVRLLETLGVEEFVRAELVTRDAAVTDRLNEEGWKCDLNSRSLQSHPAR